MYQSIPARTIPRVTAGELQVLTALRVGFLPNCLCLGGQGFEFEKFSTVLEEKCRNFSICFKETGGSFAKPLFLCCFISIFVKIVGICLIFNKIDHFQLFGHFDKISGYPRVIFSNARSSLKLCLSYIARTIVNILCGILDQ